MIKSEFEKFYLSKHHFGRSTLDDYTKAQNKTLGYINPTIIEERPLNITCLDVFSKLIQDRIIWFGSEVTSETCNIVNAQLLYLDSVDQSPINCYVNSPGGSVIDGLSTVATFDLIQSDVCTVAAGMAASMGMILLVSGTKGKRSALKYSRILMHQPLGQARGQASDIEIEAKEILRHKRELYTLISERTGQPYEKIEKDADRDFWLSPEEALDYGIIDSIVSKK